MPQDNEETSFKDEFQQEVAPIEKQDEDPTLAPESIKDRRHRRLERSLQESREMNIALNERVKMLSETDRFRQEMGADEDIHKVLYGDQVETTQTRAIAQNLQRLLDKRDEAVEERAFRKLQETNQSESREVQENVSYLEDEFEAIEDRFAIDLSGDTEASRKIRDGFIDYIGALSRKDRRTGEILDYPDIQTAWGEYNSRRTRSTGGRAAEVADRSMGSSMGSDAMNESQQKALEKEWLEKGYI